MYDTLETTFSETGRKVVIDSAFKLRSCDFLVKSSQDVEDGDCNDIVVNTVATSVMKLGEWGMIMIQTQFLWLKDPLPIHDDIKRRIILHLMVHLFNFLVSQFGINQILNNYIGCSCYFSYPNITADANHLVI